MVSAAAVRLRCALWVAAVDPPRRPTLPAPSAVSVAIEPEVDRSFYVHVGYLVRGPRAIRADVLERVLERRANSTDEELASMLGCPRPQLAAALRALDSTAHRRRSRRRHKRRPGAA